VGAATDPGVAWWPRAGASQTFQSARAAAGAASWSAAEAWWARRGMGHRHILGSSFVGPLRGAHRGGLVRHGEAGCGGGRRGRSEGARGHVSPMSVLALTDMTSHVSVSLTSTPWCCQRTCFRGDVIVIEVLQYSHSSKLVQRVTTNWRSRSAACTLLGNYEAVVGLGTSPWETTVPIRSLVCWATLPVRCRRYHYLPPQQTADSTE